MSRPIAMVTYGSGRDRGHVQVTTPESDVGHAHRDKALRAGLEGGRGWCAIDGDALVLKRPADRSVGGHALRLELRSRVADVRDDVKASLRASGYAIRTRR